MPFIIDSRTASDRRDGDRNFPRANCLHESCIGGTDDISDVRRLAIRPHPHPEHEVSL